MVTVIDADSLCAMGAKAPAEKLRTQLKLRLTVFSDIALHCAYAKL